MSDFKYFVEKNCLQRKALAEYLKVSASFITQLCNGERKLPEEKLNLIKANPNWDASMLDKSSIMQEGNGIIINGGNNMENSSIVNDHRHYTSDSPDVLRQDIARLETIIAEKEDRIKEKDAQIKEKDAQIKEKDAQINKLLDILKSK